MKLNDCWSKRLYLYPWALQTTALMDLDSRSGNSTGYRRKPCMIALFDSTWQFSNVLTTDFLEDSHPHWYKESITGRVFLQTRLDPI